jgi:VWFA-related protein
MRRYYALAPIFVSLLSCSLLAQTPPPDVAGQQPAIKSEVRIVFVDVVVTRGQGETVGGLHKEDFQATEDGQPQKISFFEEHTGGRVSAVPMPPMPPDVYTNYPRVKLTDSVNVLLLDSLNTQAVDQTYVRPQMAKYLEAAMAAPTGARLAIFTLGSTLRMVKGFTEDSSDLKASLLDPKSETQAKFESQMASPSRKAGEKFACDRIRSAPGQDACRDFMADEAGNRNGDRVGMTLQAFQALARYLAPIPGRKNVMWLAGSFPVHFFPDTGARRKIPVSHQAEVQQTAELLTADQVAVYPIQATGLDPSAVNDPTNYGKPIEADEADRSFNQIAMELLARDTGGKAFYNTNGLSEAMAQAIAEGSHFYTLTYAPTNAIMDGKYRHIEVKIIDGNYKLAYRRGYYAENAKFASTSDENRKSDALLPLIGFGMPDFAQIMYKVRVQPVTVPRTEQAGSIEELRQRPVRYGLDFAISPQDLRLETTSDGVRHGGVEVTVIAYDRDGKALSVVSKKSEIALKPDVYMDLMRVGLQVHKEIDVPGGEVYLRTGVYDLNSSKAGTLGIALGGRAAAGAQ